MVKNNLREAREKVGLSQTKLGCLVGVAPSLLSDVELGKRQLWPKARRAVANALGLPEAQLFPENGNGQARG